MAVQRGRREQEKKTAEAHTEKETGWMSLQVRFSMKEEDAPWQLEYKDGANNSCHLLVLNDDAKHLKLKDIWLELFMDYQILMVAAICGEEKEMVMASELRGRRVEESMVVMVVGTWTQVRTSDVNSEREVRGPAVGSVYLPFPSL